MEMTRLHEEIAHEIDIADHVQTRQFKQTGAWQKSQSSPTVEGNALTALLPLRDRESCTPPEVQSVTDQRPPKIMTAPKTQSVPDPKVPSHRGHRRSSPEVTQPSESAIFERDGV